MRDSALKRLIICVGNAILLQVLAIALFAAGAGERLSYENARLDDSGQLHIKQINGREFLAPKLPNQARFAAPAISPDRLSVGWLAEFQDTSSPSLIDPDAFTLVIYRNGQIFRQFGGDPIFWDWKFERGGKEVAYSTGPRHGGANECILLDIDSGKVLEEWSTSSEGKPPSWAEPLRR